MPLRIHISPKLAAVGCILTGVAGGSGAYAGGWDLTPRVTASETYTDNVALAKDNTDSDFITIVSPGFTLSRTGAARSRLDVDFSVDVVRYADDSSRDETREFLTADAGVELFEDLFFIDGLASISQVNISQTGVESGAGLTDEANRTQAFAGTINPNYRQHIGNIADARIDYTYSHTQTEKDVVDKTETHRIAASVTSGRDFAFLKWTVDLSAEEKEFSESNRKDKRKLANLELQYVDRILFQPIATIGYETFEDETLADEPDGLIWSVGGLLQPGPRTSIRITHGRRYDDPNTSVEATYDITSRTKLGLSVDQSLETTQGLAISELSADEPPLDPASRGFSLTNNTFKQTDITAFLDAERGRNTYRVEARWSDRDTSATGEETIVQSITASWERDINRSLTGRLNASFRDTETTSIVTNRDDQFATVGVVLDYRLDEDWRTSLGLHRDQAVFQC